MDTSALYSDIVLPAATFYEKVYEAPRPELFFKATPGRVVGPGQAVRIRQDANWSVPEPELALVLNSRLQLVGHCFRHASHSGAPESGAARRIRTARS